jgi:hypothetical protein
MSAPRGPGSRVEWKASQGGPLTPTMLVARSEPQWRHLATLFSLRPPLPPIDFARQMVVAVSLGQRPTGGYAVEIVGAEERDGVLHVLYLERGPRPDDFVTQVLTTPYHVRVLTRSEAPQVVFQRVDSVAR